jgi:mono/diheme cytochrome c family protein
VDEEAKIENGELLALAEEKSETEDKTAALQRSAHGEKQFNNYCAACHRRGGQGEEGRIPPLTNSPWVSGSEDRLVRIVLNGLRGPIEIGGQIYNLEMPTFRMLFQDDDIASLLSYVRRRYGAPSPPVTSETVARVREETQDRTRYWTVEELQRIP